METHKISDGTSGGLNFPVMGVAQYHIMSSVTASVYFAFNNMKKRDQFAELWDMTQKECLFFVYQN